MGFIDRLKELKGFLQKQQPKEPIVIVYNDLESWINKQSSEAVLELDAKIKIVHQKLVDEINQLKQYSDKLKNAPLMNEQIIVKAKQVMEGNRETYLKRIELFIQSLNLANTGYFSSKLLIPAFEDQLKQFIENTQKNSYVLNQFFSHQIKAINTHFKNSAKLIEELSLLIENSNIDYLFRAKDLLKQIAEKEKTLAKHKQTIVEHKKELQDLRVTRERYEQKLEQLEKSEAFSHFKQLLEEREQTLKSIQDIDKNLFEKFSILDRPLRKYAYQNPNDNIINRYLVHAMSALSEDELLAIADVLLKVKKTLEQEKVSLKDKQKDKAGETITLLTKEELTKLRSRYNRLKQQKILLDQNIKTNALIHDYNDLKYKVEHYHNRSKNIIDIINESERTSYILQIDRLKLELANTLRKFNENITLEFTPKPEEEIKGKTVHIIFNEDALKQLEENSQDALNTKETPQLTNDANNNNSKSNLIELDPQDDLSIEAKNNNEADNTNAEQLPQQEIRNQSNNNNP